MGVLAYSRVDGEGKVVARGGNGWLGERMRDCCGGDWGDTRVERARCREW